MTKKINITNENFGEKLLESAEEALEITKEITKIEELQNKIKEGKEAQIELIKLQASCEHKNGHSIGVWSWGIGHLSIEKICVVCKQKIDGITDKETEDFEN